MSGVTTNPIVRRIVIRRGMPLLTQVTRVSMPCPPAAWSAMLASQIARYSGVNGGLCGSPGFFVSSHELTGPGARRHCPDQTRYFVSSKASAAVTDIASVAANGTTIRAMAPIELRLSIVFPPAVLGAYQALSAVRSSGALYHHRTTTE